MEIRVVAAERSDKKALENLFQLYAHDFSEILPLEVDASGRFEAPSLDVYWSDPSRFPFLIRADAHLAGFALVDRKSRLSGADDVWDMGEFFVLRRHRRSGVGTKAAHRLFGMHSGEWEVRQGKANVAATSFWRAAISAFTGGTYSEELVDDERWRGPVQRFTSEGGAEPAAP
jgi:predicted acetyltransferase